MAGLYVYSLEDYIRDLGADYTDAGYRLSADKRKRF